MSMARQGWRTDMFLIHCPYCDEHREEEEFHAAGQAHMPRPKDPDSMSDEAWGEYLNYRKNSRGTHRELWHHSAGCGKYFNVLRDTVSYKIYGSYKAGEWLELPDGVVDARVATQAKRAHEPDKQSQQVAKSALGVFGANNRQKSGDGA